MALKTLIIAIILNCSNKGDIEMVLKALIKPAKVITAQEPEKKEEQVQKFISQGGGVAVEENMQEGKNNEQDHRLTLRIPQWLMDKVDQKRKERVGSISRNLWILEQLEKACKK